MGLEATDCVSEAADDEEREWTLVATEWAGDVCTSQGGLCGGNQGGRLARFCQYGSLVGFRPMVCVDTVVVVLVEDAV